MRQWSDFVNSNPLFQSTPGIAAGRCIMSYATASLFIQFQSTPGIAAGRCLWPLQHQAALECFNPRPALLPGDALEAAAQRPPFEWFQSTPGIAAGRCFGRCSIKLLLSVSIHARHCCRAMRQERRIGDFLIAVSIHARHCCRAMLNAEIDAPNGKLFQSTPGIAAGRCSSRPIGCQQRHFWCLCANRLVSPDSIDEKESKNSENSFESRACEDREPYSGKSTTWGSRQ